MWGRWTATRSARPTAQPTRRWAGRCSLRRGTTRAAARCSRGRPGVGGGVGLGRGPRRVRLLREPAPDRLDRRAPHFGRRLDQSSALAPLTPSAGFAGSGRSAKFPFFRLTFHNSPVLSKLVFRPLLCSGPAVGLLAGRAAGFFRAPRRCREPRMNENDFHDALRADPHDLALRLVFADWLEERGDPRGELPRLTHLLTRPDDPPHRPP